MINFTFKKYLLMVLLSIISGISPLILAFFISLGSEKTFLEIWNVLHWFMIFTVPWAMLSIISLTILYLYVWIFKNKETKKVKSIFTFIFIIIFSTIYIFYSEKKNIVNIKRIIFKK